MRTVRNQTRKGELDSAVAGHRARVQCHVAALAPPQVANWSAQARQVLASV